MYEWEQLFQSQSRRCRYKYALKVIHKIKFGLELLLVFEYGIGIFFYLIPLVHNHYARLALFVHEAGNSYTNNYSYAWLAEKCYVTETTVRNWMARKVIPAAKEHIIREMMKELPLSLPSRVQVTEETRVTLSLDPATRKVLEKKAFAQGKTLAEFLADEVPRLGE